MHNGGKKADITIISYKAQSGVRFARYTGQYWSYMPSSLFGVHKPLCWPSSYLFVWSHRLVLHGRLDGLD